MDMGVMDRIVAGGIKKEGDRKQTKGLYLFPFNKDTTTLNADIVLYADEITDETPENPEGREKKARTPISIKCVGLYKDLTLTRVGLYSVLYNKGGNTPKVECCCTLQQIIERLTQQKDAQNEKGKKDNLESILKTFESALKKENELDGMVTATEDGEVYLSLVRERRVTLPMREYSEFIPIGLFYLKLEEDFSKSSVISYVGWQPRKIKLEQKLNNNYLYIAEKHEIVYGTISRNQFEPDTRYSFDLYETEQIIDFDANDKFVAVVVNDNKSGITNVLIQDKSSQIVYEYTPDRWLGIQAIRPLCIKLFKQSDKPEETFCSIGCYKGFMVMLGYSEERKTENLWDIVTSHCFLSKEELDDLSSVDSKKSAIKQISIAKGDNLIFTLSNFVVCGLMERLTDSQNQIECYIEKEISGVSRSETRHRIIIFDHYIV